MKRQIRISFLLCMLFTGAAQAQEVRISRLDFATSIENREPAGIDTSFASNIGNIFCFTQIEGAPDTSKIFHVWYYKDEEKARISLDVQSNNWRTWSSKTIQKNWTGNWRVIVEDSKGNVLASKTFTIR